MEDNYIDGTNMTNEEFARAIAEALNSIEENVIGNDTFEVNGFIYEIDTCFVHDYGKYETAIGFSGILEWVIVEHYNTAEEAKAGHDKWVLDCFRNRPTFFYDITAHKIYGYMEEEDK